MQIIDLCKISNGEISDIHGLYFSSEEYSLKRLLKDYYKSEQISYPKFYKMDEQCKLAFIATEVLLRNFAREDYNDEEIAMVFANSESTLATDMSFWESTFSIASPGLFVYTLPNIMMGEIAIRNKIKGENIFFISEEYDAKLLYQQTELVFLNTSAQIAIVGWVNYQNEELYSAKLFLISKLNDGMNTFNLESFTTLNN
jgi:hypothetical protein